MQDNISVVAAPLPFSNAQQKFAALPGTSLAEIVRNVFSEDLQRAGCGAIVMINGDIIPAENWKSVKPKTGTIVNIRIVPTGGGGKKNPLVSLLSIAVLVAAPYLSAAILGPTLAATQIGIGTLTYGGLLSTGIGVVGRMLISALAPPPKPSNYGKGGSSPAESPTQFIEGAQNQLLPYGVVPICLGTNRMFPPQATRGYTETIGNDQYVRQIFTYGWGELDISDRRIGETEISEFDGVEMEDRLSGNLHVSTKVFPNDVNQENFSVLLTQADGYVIRSTANNTDEAEVDFTFLSGLTAFNASARRRVHTVELELSYALSGASPQVWSPVTGGYKSYAAQVNVLPAAAVVGSNSGLILYGSKTYIYSLDKMTGVADISGNGVMPAGNIRLATVTVNTQQARLTGVTTSTVSIVDNRTPDLTGPVFQSSTDFEVTNSGLTITVAAGSLKGQTLKYTAAQTEALRGSTRVKFPQPGKYDLRARRITADSVSDQIIDEVHLTAIKSIRYAAPINLQGMSGTAMMMKGTDQLNGQVNQYNVLARTILKDYNADTDEWIPGRISSNPASLYRYVLQSPANARALPDAKINLLDLQDWHQHCLENGYTYNRVIDYEASLDDILRDIAAAGSATPAIVDGKRTIVIDRIKSPSAVVTARNSWGYTGKMIYPELPHAFRVTFRNKEKGYQQDEIIVYDDGYDESNATRFETLELMSCTDSALAFKTGRRHIATARQQPEEHSFMQDVENLCYVRGDRIKLQHDIPIIGIGDGRVKTVQTDGGSPLLVTGFTIDDTVTVPNGGTFYTRMRLADGTQIYERLDTVIGETNTFVFSEPFPAALGPEPGDLCYFVEAGGELDVIVTRIDHAEDLTARITAVNYAPERFDAENSPTPPFNSNITTPLEFIRPLPPVLLSAQSDENAMIENSDGTFISRAIFSLQNDNEGDVDISVKIRLSGSNTFTNANVLEATPSRLILTGMDDGSRYDIHIRYKRPGGAVYSTALELNNYLFVGSTGNPPDVDQFRLNVSDNLALFSWTKSRSKTHAFYRIKHSSLFSGVTYGTAQLFADELTDNRLQVPFQPGTYFVVDVNEAGKESLNPKAIITYDPGLLENTVAELEDNPGWIGVKDNVVLDGSSIILDDPDLALGYYYFDDIIDVGGLALCVLSFALEANGTIIGGAGNNDLFMESDIFAMSDIFGIGEDGWTAQIQMSITETDPLNSPAGWGEWQPATAGSFPLWGARFRVELRSTQQYVSPQITRALARVNMPPRIARGEDMPVDDVTGATVVFDPPFKEIPAIVITIQDGAADDKIEFTAKDTGGFSFKVYNETTAGYVDRSFDYIASGYGRVTT